MFTRIALLKVLDATVGFILCWILGCARFLFGGRTVSEDFRNRRPGRILVIRPGGIGDMVLLLPVIERIRTEFPGAEIDLVCEKRNLEVLELAGLSGCAIPYDSAPFRLLWRFWRTKYDVAIDTEQFHNFSAVLSLLSGAPARIGFKINPNRNLLYTHLVNYAMDEYEGVQFMRLLAPLHVSNLDYHIEGILAGVSVRESAAIGPTLKAMREAKSYVALSPGSTTAYKRWDAAKFAAVANHLMARRGLAVVLVGGRDARLAANIISKSVSNPEGILCPGVGRLPLVDTVALIRDACLFVGGDSGLAHLAVALGVPTVVLFGPSDDMKWGVNDLRHAVVRKPIPCAPCFIFGYHRLCRAPACMAEISIRDVTDACDRILNAGPVGAVQTKSA